MAKLTVDLGTRSYPIYIETGLLTKIGEFIANHRLGERFVIITNDIVDGLYGEQVLVSLSNAGLQVEKIVIQDGERYKTLQSFEGIITQMLRMKFDRKSTVIALGGGVVGDIAGFAAAAFMRGVQFIQIPTTLLAQVDASVGGKVGVNHLLGKNMIGAFHQPAMVVVDPLVLKTLPNREIVCGLGEIIKHAFIRDRNYFDEIEAGFNKILICDLKFLEKIIQRSCEIKASIVAQDEKENGTRALLNFGHTVGHALEAAGHYKILRHGEAVIVGMLAEAYIAKACYGLSENEFDRIVNFLCGVPLKQSLEGIPTEQIDDFISRDKKASVGKIPMILLPRIGQAEISHNWDRSQLPSAVEYAIKAFGS